MTNERLESINLITPAQFADLDKNTKLISVHATEVISDDIDLKQQETRGGFLPYGFVRGTEPEGVSLVPNGLWKIDWETVDFLASQNLL